MVALEAMIMKQPVFQLTVSSVQFVVLAFSLVQYRTCNVPEERPGKKSAICFHVRFLFSFSSIKS